MLRSTVFSVWSHRETFLCLVGARRPNHCNLPISVASAFLIGLAGCVGYMPGKQGYWDEQLKQLCEKDGGVTIYERIPISKIDITRQVLPRSADGRLSVAIKDLAHPDAPVYAVEDITYIGTERNPRISRTEMSVIRRVDKVIVATWISYGRFGGDLPTGLVHDSSFVCPDVENAATELARLFVVDASSHD